MPFLSAAAALLFALTPLPGQFADELLDKAAAALKKGDATAALTLVNQALAADGKSARAYELRGIVYNQQRKYPESLADFSKALELNPKAADALDRRGSVHFMLGNIKESIADFDKFLELRPDEFAGHWRRGITLYYGGKYDEGRKQFAGYEKVDTNDVENSVWHCLCAARVIGLEKARTNLLKIGFDRRVPMMVVYDLFRGTAKPEDVLAAAEAGQADAAERTRRHFYAHLYLGLYYEMVGQPEKSLEHLTIMVEKHKLPGHYMWETGRVHLELRKKEAKKP